MTASLIELAGFLLVLAGFWILSPVVGLIMTGLALVLFAQALDGGGER